MRFLAFALGCTGLLAFSAPALAEDPTPPRVEDVAEARAGDSLPVLVEDCAAPCAGYEVTTELQNDWTFAADPSFLRSDVLQPTVTLDLFFAPTDHLLFAASIPTEPVIDPEPGENAFFQGIGTYVGELYAATQVGPATFRAGKFDTVFSLASEILPGINSTDLVSGFDADERLAGEAVIRFDALGINHALAATAFTTDRTILSESLFTNRGRTSLADGGAGNTSGISSFSIALNGCSGAGTAECYLKGDYGYRLGFRYQKAGLAADAGLEGEGEGGEEAGEPLPPPGDELAYLAAATRSFDLGSAKVRVLGEAAYIKHLDSGPDDAVFLTGSAALDVKPLTYVATYTQKRNLVAEGPDTREHLADFEVIYESQKDAPFAGSQWTLGAAYTFAQNAEGERAHTLSLRATLKFGGETEFGR